MCWVVRLLFALLTVLSPAHQVAAFPSQAGGCVGGRPAVGGAHLAGDKETETGSLENSDYEVAIDGNVLADGALYTLTPGVKHEITLIATGDEPFKGFLFRFGWPDQAEVEPLWTVTPGEGLAQRAAVCFIRAVGTCHSNNREKTLASTTFQIDEELDGLTLDVTVVAENDSTESVYYYSGYELNSIALPPETDPPTPSPPPPAEEIPIPSDVPSDIASDIPSDVQTQIPEPEDPGSPLPPRPCSSEETALRECYLTFDGWEECDSVRYLKPVEYCCYSSFIYLS